MYLVLTIRSLGERRRRRRRGREGKGEKIFKKSVRRTNTFQSIGPPSLPPSLARQFFMSRVYSRCNPLLLVHPRHSSVYRYSSVRLYLPATFQFHRDGGTSAPRAPRRFFFFFLFSSTPPPLPLLPPPHACPRPILDTTRKIR